MPAQQTTQNSIYPLVSTRRLRFALHTNIDLIELASNAGASYNSFDIYKGLRSDGTEKWRHIDNPVDPLREVQQKIYKYLLKPYAGQLPDYMTGGMPFRSIKDNANPHLGNEAVLGLDISNCFPSIKNKTIYKVWRNDLKCSSEVASILTRLTTFNFHLPQGATTSPILCNLALRELADEVDKYAKSKDLAFTVYVDDITISGKKETVRDSIKTLIPMVQKYGYELSKEKLNIMDSNEIQRTTGLMVNQKLTIPKQKKEELFKEIIRIGKLGNQSKTYELNSIWGKINFINSVDAKAGNSLRVHAEKHLVNIVGTPALKPGDKTRQCKSYRKKH